MAVSIMNKYASMWNGSLTNDDLSEQKYPYHYGVLRSTEEISNQFYCLVFVFVSAVSGILESHYQLQDLPVRMAVAVMAIIQQQIHATQLVLGRLPSEIIHRSICVMTFREAVHRFCAIGEESNGCLGQIDARSEQGGIISHSS
ncbi:hypothetical protein FPOAC1_003474 [Fusarium poae]|jgi:hypothetical protein|uniref:hypothetical protein n=1 Tax=Fusarium poae TaxID=36050 RepID=UPI001CE914FD|nr:hypothetical protein FPOAC1_003474 [Fusarium poae]KAG8677456.1 hypothetical protein FPOAC1_003474 [Fusarium poae]